MLEEADFDFIDAELTQNGLYLQRRNNVISFTDTIIQLHEFDGLETDAIQQKTYEFEVVNAPFADALRLAIAEPEIQLERALTFFGTQWSEAQLGIGYTMLYSHDGKSRNIGVSFEKDANKKRWAAFRKRQPEKSIY